jgi:hypothetical protein
MTSTLAACKKPVLANDCDVRIMLSTELLCTCLPEKGPRKVGQEVGASSALKLTVMVLSSPGDEVDLDNQPLAMTAYALFNRRFCSSTGVASLSIP